MAQQAVPPGLQQEIVVTAERIEQPVGETTAAITVVNQQEIEQTPAENLAELLGFAPGVLVLFPHSGGTPPMVLSRGFFGGGEVEYVRLLIDGVPAYDVESGLVDWRSLRAGDLERIEILRGPGSAVWGDTALGGVVQVFARDEPVRRLSAAAGSFDSWAGDVSFREERFSAAAAIARSDGFRAHSSSQEVFATGSIRFREWVLGLAATDRQRQEPGPLSAVEAEADRRGSNPMFSEDQEDTRRGRISLSYGDSRMRGYLFGALRDTELTRTLPILAGIGDRIFRAVSTSSMGGSLESQAEVRTTQLHFGVEGAWDELESTYHRNKDAAAITAGSASRNRAAAFAALDLELTPRLRLTMGLRLDHLGDQLGSQRQTHNAWSPRAGLNFEGAVGSAYVQLARAFKAPTLDQLFDPRPFPDFMGGSFTVSNPGLSPQTADNIEAGFSRRGPVYRIELVGYRTGVDDEIDFDLVSFRYANIGRTTHRGLELDFTLSRFAAFVPRLTYALSDVVPRGGANEGRQLKNIPRHLLRAAATVRLPLQIEAHGVASWLGERYLDDANTIRLDDATVLDVRLIRRFGSSRLRLDLLNLTDARYAELSFVLPDLQGGLVPYQFPAAGFAFRAGLDWTF